MTEKTIQETVLTWLIILGLAFSVWWLIQREPKAERRGSTIFLVAGGIVYVVGDDMQRRFSRRLSRLPGDKKVLVRNLLNSFKGIRIGVQLALVSMLVRLFAHDRSLFYVALTGFAILGLSICWFAWSYPRLKRLEESTPT